MKILGFNITRDDNKNRITGHNAQKDAVNPYYAIRQKQFGDYRTASGTSTVSYNLIEKLYRNTIMNQIINKEAGDASRLNFSVSYTDVNGNANEDAKTLCKPIDRLLTKKLLYNIFRDYIMYGDAFVYKNISADGTGDLVPMNPRYITPMTVDGSTLTGWRYSGGGGSVELKPEQVLHISNSPITGDLYGVSIFEPVIQTLNLLLNSQENEALIIDRFLLPLLQWKIGDPSKNSVTPEQINNTLEQIKNMRVGSDIATDAFVDANVIGVGGTLIDFTPILDKLETYIYVTAGVPGPILGADADNLSAITRQLQVYFDNIRQMQSILSDSLIADLYMPFLQANGRDDVTNINISWDTGSIEQNSRIITWVMPALEAGLIDQDQAAAALGYDQAAITKNPDLVKPTAPDSTPERTLK